MPDVLGMRARKICDPIAHVVLVKADNSLFHVALPFELCRHGTDDRIDWHPTTLWRDCRL